MNWYNRQFDPSWIICANSKCRAQFPLKSISKKRKCPKCKMDNKHRITPSAIPPVAECKMLTSTNEREIEMNVPDNWIEICEEEIIRGRLNSHPRKFEFAKERGLHGLDEVHSWMTETRRKFIEMVENAKDKK